MKKLFYTLLFIAFAAALIYYFATRHWIPQMASDFLMEEKQETLLPENLERQLSKVRKGLDQFMEAMPDSTANKVVNREEDELIQKDKATEDTGSITPIEQLSKVQFYYLIDNFNLKRTDELAQLYETHKPENTDALFDLIRDDVLESEKIDIEQLRTRFNKELNMKMVDSLYHYYQNHRNNLRIMLPALRNTGKELVKRKLEK